MAYVNIAEWTPEHVGEWLRGLDDAILPYVHFFLNNNIDGRHLLTLAPDDLTHLHITKVGHQELILEAINLLRLLHYNLTSENLQSLALKLGCKARSLYNELRRNGPIENTENGKQKRLSTATLASVSDILLAVKSFISWLDRNPFEGKDQYAPVRKTILKLSIELASTAQRDQFVEKPHAVIKNSCLNLADLCDKIVQEFSDSLIIQPASLDVATVKKKPDEELGMHLHSSYSGVHIVGGVKFQSPAHRCAKIEIGDEIVQVNYQTVVGWQLKKLVYAMREHSTDVYLTLKKRPRHTNILGQVIILRPYRIPSKKSAFGKVHKWSEGNSSLHIQEEFPASSLEEPSPQGEADDDDDMAFLPDYVTPTSNEVSAPCYQVLPAKSRATVQRRATVSGASPTVKRPPVSIEDLVLGTKLWKKEVIGRSISHDPSKHVVTSESTFTSQKLDTIKSDGSEDNCEKVELSPVDEKPTLSDHSENSNLLDKESSKMDSLSHTASVCSDTSLKASSIVIPLPEEEYTILENKSLGKIGNGSEKIPVKEEQSERDAAKQSESQKSEKKTQLTGPWEGTDTVFHGRRPSAQELDNEIASSSMGDDPVLMKVAPVMSFLNEDNKEAPDSSETTASTDMKSYQVVIVGGVPQKSVSPGREIKPSTLQSPLLRRKSSVTSKFATRRVSCKDLGNGDCQGWLYKQKEQKRFLTGARWTKRWVVLKQCHLYSYQNREDPRAECLIFLPGFTVSPAPECKSKKYAFKLHHPGTTFYFATDSQDDMTKWMNKLGLAAIRYNISSDEPAGGFVKTEKSENAYYSETEDESEDNSPAGSRSLYSRESSPSSVSSANIRNLFYEHLQGDYHLEDTSNSVSSLQSQISIDGKQNFRYLQSKQMRSGSRKQSGLSSSNYFRQESLQSQDSKCAPSFRAGYVRSLSCTDAPSRYMHHFSPEKHGSHFPAGSQFPRKMSYQEHSSGTTFLGTEGKCGNPKLHRLSGQWASTEDKAQDYPTGSLGRQRMLAREITPGLVARMTGSYNNLSQKNVQGTSVERRKSKESSTPAAGYVAKLSGSFDQLAKSGWKASAKAQPGNCTETVSTGMVNNFQRDDTDSNNQNSGVKQWRSESVPESDNKTEKFVSMLDKEYHRLYGKKKPSTISIHNARERQERSSRSGASSEVAGSYKNSQLNKNTSSAYVAERVSSQKQSYHSSPGKQTVAGASRKEDGIKTAKSNSNYCLQQSKSSQAVVTKQAHVKSIFTHDQKNKGMHGSSAKNETNIHRSAYEIAADHLEQKRPSKETSFDYDEGHSSFKHSFKFFGSPKFMKKFASPKQEKKPTFKCKFAQSQEKIAPVLQERTFLGSPKLARAIFGSPKCERKAVTTMSAAVQTDKNIDFTPSDSLKPNVSKSDIQSSSSQCHQEATEECLKTSSNSSLNSSASGSAISSTGSSHYYVETRIRPQITISLPLVTESNSDDRPTTPETPRTPKPTMGIAMIGKRRTPSVSAENKTGTSVGGKGTEHFTFERNEIMVNINDQETDDDIIQLLHCLRQSDITLDGVDIRSRRCRTLLRDEKAISQLIRSLSALQRTLKDKEMELAAIDALLKGTVTSKKLELWARQYPHYMPSGYC